MLTSTVDRILVALKAVVDNNVNFHLWRDSGGLESYGYSLKEMADPPEKEMLNVVEPHFLECGGRICE